VFPFSFFAEFFDFNLEEEYTAGASYDKYFVINEVHLAKIQRCHSINLIFTNIITLNDKAIPLPVERIDLIEIRIVKALVWEILG